MGGLIVVIAVVCLGAPAFRLLASAARERREPELWLGLCLAFAAIGVPLRLYSGVEVALHVDQGIEISTRLGLISAAAHWTLGLASAGLYLFVWRVFHPTSAIARRGVSIVLTALFASTVWLILSDGHLHERATSVSVSNLIRGIALPWCAIESFRYWRLMRRRVALELGDPVVANRFALWAIWTGTFSFLPMLVLATKVISYASGDQSGTLETMLPLIRGFALCCVILAFSCVWLSFFPPNSYLARIRAFAIAA